MGPGSNRQIGGVEDLCRSVGTTWGHRDSNRLATLVDLRRAVGTLGVGGCLRRPRRIGGTRGLVRHRRGFLRTLGSQQLGGTRGLRPCRRTPQRSRMPQARPTEQRR